MPLNKETKLNLKILEKINQLMNMNDIKRFAKKEKKELETLIQAVRIYTEDLGIKFGIEKCTTLIMGSRKRHITKEIELLNQEEIRMHWKKKTYKYLGILEADTSKQVETKEKN